MDFIILLSLVAVGYDSMGGIIRGDAYLDPIPFYDSDSVLFHAAGKNGPHSYTVVAFDFHTPATQDPGNHTLHLDEIVSCQNTPFIISK